MAQELAGKVAIVTGGAHGIGRATVDLFVQEGARVVIGDINDELGEQAAKELGSAVRFRHCDVAKAAEMEALVAHAVAEFGGLHVMMNNAGLSEPNFGPFVDADFSRFERITEINVLGVMLGTQYAARHMKAHGGGSIINVASIAGSRPGHGFWIYRACKAGVINFTKSAAIDLGPDMIRVNCICPGNIPTHARHVKGDDPGMTDEKAQEVRGAMLDVRMKRQPLKRQGHAIDIAQGAMFLGSDRAAQISGLIMPIDAGATAGDPVSLIQQIMNARAEILAN
jgi:NAD(P)-dependent dehydrogenase (short-subunit alcohol dehydrogenase family)